MRVEHRCWDVPANLGFRAEQTDIDNRLLTVDIGCLVLGVTRWPDLEDRVELAGVEAWPCCVLVDVHELGGRTELRFEDHLGDMGIDRRTSPRVDGKADSGTTCRGCRCCGISNRRGGSCGISNWRCCRCFGHRYGVACGRGFRRGSGIAGLLATAPAGRQRKRQHCCQGQSSTFPEHFGHRSPLNSS